MNASTCCFRIKYCKREPNSFSLYSNEYHAPNDFERIRELFIRKYYTVPYSVTTLNNFISDNESVESLNCRLNDLLRRIADDLGRIIKIEKSEPIYDDKGLCSWSIIIYVEFIEPIEQMPSFDDFYRIGMVCRSNEDESSFSFFDDDGNLYQLEKKGINLEIGDIIVFKTHRFLIEPEDDNIEEDDSLGEENEKKRMRRKYFEDDFDLFLDSSSTKPALSPFIDEQERIQDESSWKRESARVSYTLSSDFVLFSELEPFTTERRTRGFSHSMKRLSFKLKGDSVLLYDDFWKCVFCSSLGESAILRYSLLPSISEATLSTYMDLNKKCSQIWEYVNGLDIKKIFSSYQITVNDSGIVNHSDERYRRYVPYIETEDQYIRGLFPLEEKSYDWIYSYGDEELIDQHDTQAEKQAIELALKKYNKEEHFSFLLYNSIVPTQQRLVLQREINRFWPLYYFENLLANIPGQNLESFINEHNQKRLYYRKVKFDYIKSDGH